jgi:hypothetical protein
MSTSMRNKRMGIITRKPAEEKRFVPRMDNRSSHLRGLSDNSALQTGVAPAVNPDSSSPTSPIDGVEHRSAAFVRRLSSLPEGKRKSQMDDPFLDLARGFLYALDQIHAPIKRLIGNSKDGTRSELEKACRHAYNAANELEQLLQKATSHDEEIEEDEHAKIGVAVRRSCESCMDTFEKLVVTLQADLRKVITEGNQQCVRTLMLLLYGSLVEIRNSCSRLGVEMRPAPRAAKRSVSRGRYLSPAPAPANPVTSLRVRDRTPHERSLSRSNSTSKTVIPAGIVPARAVAGPSISRSGSNASLVPPAVTVNPYAGSTARNSRSNTLMSVDEGEEEVQFDVIAKQLANACDFAMQALPRCDAIVATSRRLVQDRTATAAELEVFDTIMDRCRIAFEAAKQLRSTLANLKFREPGTKNQLDFWQLVMSFVRVCCSFRKI